MSGVDSSGQWKYNMTSCTGPNFTGNEYKTRTENASGVDCTKQCCVYSNLIGTDTGTSNCTACAEANGTSNKNWASSGDLKLRNVSGTQVSVPYCNRSGVAYGNNGQGFALSLQNSETSDDVGSFGNPADCLSTGKFAGQCAGIPGCSGLDNNVFNYLNTCAVGFSSQPPYNPAGNCPNTDTLINSWRQCSFSTTNGQVCADGKGYNECDDNFKNESRVLIFGGKPTNIREISIPEGAWVTAYDNTGHVDNTNYAICDPSQFPDGGTDAWTFGCGKDSQGNLEGRMKAIKVLPSGNWTDATNKTENVGQCNESDPSCVNTDTSWDETRETGDVTVDPSGGTCTFTIQNGTPMYGWQLGFLPGYYNSTCQTNANGNACGTIAP